MLFFRGVTVTTENRAGAHARRADLTIDGLFEAHGRDLLGYLRTLTADEAVAEDALQEVFVRLAARRERLAEMDEPRAYLFRMARNEALRLIARDRSRRVRETTAACPARWESRPAAGLPVETVAALEQGLARLPDEQREAVFLRCVEGFTIEEVAALAGVPRDTAASRYRYGIEKLRSLMGAE
jgi:RNA polymerase sigma-70 factor (ECF subfamily)